MTTPNPYGRTLRAARESAGLSLHELGVRIGMPMGAVASVEMGFTYPFDPIVTALIVKALRLSMGASVLLTGYAGPSEEWEGASAELASLAATEAGEKS